MSQNYYPPTAPEDERVLTALELFSSRFSWIGAGALFVFSFLIRPGVRETYGQAKIIDKVVDLVLQPAVAFCSITAMLFCAWYGTKLRKEYNHKNATKVLVFGALVSLVCNGVILYVIYQRGVASFEQMGR